jgi:serine/threonine protein kinase
MHRGPSELASGIHEGDVIAAKYRVEKVLGAGGMGVVIAARHIQLDERVALKFLLPAALGNPEAMARFIREARAAVRIKSEHVARVTDVGTLENGMPYMVMEYLDGGDLCGWLKQRGAMPVAQAVDFVLQACEALADAHALGIVHRDLKPANLFCIERSDGQLSIKVLDFGISKILTPGAPGHDVTSTSSLMGSPLYMSPEQMQLSKGVDVRTDIWSLGVILFELVTGRPPFWAEAVTELAIKVANEPPPPLRALLPDAPWKLEQAVARCLEKDREKRFQTVGDLARALADLASKDGRGSVERVFRTLRKAGIPGAGPPRSAEFDAAVEAVPAKTPLNTAAPWGTTGAGNKARAPGKAIFAMTAAAALIALVAGATLFSRRALPLPSSAPGPMAAPVSTPAPSPSPQTDPANLPIAPGDALAVLPMPEKPAASPPSRPATPARPKGNTVTASATVSPPPGPSRANCDPPYEVNAKGSHIFKKECL